MILNDQQIKRVIRTVVNDMMMHGDALVEALGRYPTEDECQQFTLLYAAKLREALEEFEFLDPEDSPPSRIQLWCADHKGVGFRRPKGHVVYTVTGEVDRWTHGMVLTEVPLVKRSSDGKVVPMLITDLEQMLNEG